MIFLADLNMLKTPIETKQIGMFLSFEDQLNEHHPLYKLSHIIGWKVFEEEFKKYYSLTHGAPAKPIRLMVALLILKQLRNLSDESVVEQWAENSYYQYFSGAKHFTPHAPCSSTELVEFRKRIGVEGIELIFKASIEANGKDADDDNLSGDTTIQEKNITYPTDDKLHKRIISKCQSIAVEEQIQLRQSYRRTVKKLSVVQRMKRLKNGDLKARKANKKIKTIAGRLVRELERKLTAAALVKYGNNLQLFSRVLSQKRHDTNKIYSLHEPDVKCYSKGKEHKKFEFGSKACLLITQRAGVIVGAMNFTESLHDTKTLEPILEQHQRLTGKPAINVYLDRGFRGPRQINGTNLFTPKPDHNISSSTRKRFKRRAAIEPTISHLKFDHRMIRNFLKGTAGDAINLMLAATSFNFKRVMNKLKQKISFLLRKLILFYNIIMGCGLYSTQKKAFLRVD